MSIHSTSVTLNQKVQTHSDGSKERWRDVPGWQGYYRVSDRGRVKSLARKTICRDPWGGQRTYTVKPKIISDRKPANNGYIMVGFTKPGKSKLTAIHALVLLAFVGEKPKGTECRHLDGNKMNNCLSNLKWGTNKEQISDRIKHGTIRRGEGIGNSKLTEKQVIEIRRTYKPKTYRLVRMLTNKYGISAASLFAIINRKTWKHV